MIQLNRLPTCEPIKPIIDYLVHQTHPKRHFAKDLALDEAFRSRFGTKLEAAARCELLAQRPHMQSDSALLHQQAIALFAKQGMENSLGPELR